MQNPYSKFILAIKTLISDRFSKLLQVLLQQIEIQMLNRKYFPCLPAVKNARQKIINRGQFLHFCTQTILKNLKRFIFYSCKSAVYCIYTQTKMKRPFFMVLYLWIQLRCRHKTNTQMFSLHKRHEYW